MVRSPDTRLTRGIWLLTLLITGLGVGLLSTAIYSFDGKLDTQYAVKQAVFAVVGLLAAWGVSRVSIEWLERRWAQAWVLCVGAIAVVFLLGTAIRGSRRWIVLGPVNLQPSEVGKLLVIVAVCGFITQRARELERPSQLVATLGVIGVPAAMVFVQPDFGTAQIYAVIALAAVFFAGARWLHVGLIVGSVTILAVLVLGVLPAVGMHVLKPYQEQRFTGFLHPDNDPQGLNYHTRQSEIAVGSGQLTGKSAKAATQVRQNFLPEPQTDFIFATLSERYGLLGGVVVLLLYSLLIARIVRVINVAPTRFGRLVCGCVAAMFAGQVFINVGMVIGLMPITGVPLPLFSYGGSALIANLASIGLVAAVLRTSESAPVRYARRSGTTRTAPTAVRRRSVVATPGAAGRSRRSAQRTGRSRLRG